MTRTRLLAASVMAPVAIAAVLLLPTPWMAVVSAAMFLIGLWEWLKLAEIDDPIARSASQRDTLRASLPPSAPACFVSSCTT